MTSRKKSNKTEKKLKSIGVKMTESLAEDWQRFSEEIDKSQIFVLESALKHFLELPREKQGEILKKYWIESFSI